MQTEQAHTLSYKPDVGRLVLFLLALGAAALLYTNFGMDSESAQESTSVFKWLLRQWGHENFKDLWIMLLVAAFVIYKKKDDLAKAKITSSVLGLLVVAGSLAIHIFGYKTQMPRISLGSTVGVAWGLAYAIYGWNVAKILLFPAGYTLLCFMGSLLMEVTMPLRMMASSLACVFLHGAGIEAVQRGTVVFSAAGGGFQFDVADACSGLHSLITMAALAAPYAYFTLTGLWRKWILFALALPLAMVANALRIFTLGAVAEWIGMDLAMTLYHDMSGYLVFMLSLLLLIGTGAVIEIDWKAKLCSLKNQKASSSASSPSH